MKKISIKILATILVAILMIANFSFISTVKANTNGYTPDTAIEYVKSLIGQQIDVDGAYPGECVDLIMAYEKELSGFFDTRKCS